MNKRPLNILCCKLLYHIYVYDMISLASKKERNGKRAVSWSVMKSQNARLNIHELPA